MSEPSPSRLSPPGSGLYSSNTLHVGDGTWDSDRNTFLLPNLMPLNFATTRYNGMGNRFKDDKHYHSIIAGHAAMAAVTFLGLIPYAIFVVRFGDHSKPEGSSRPSRAMRYHIWTQILVFLLSTVVLTLGWFAVGSARSLTNPHHAIGLALYVLIVVQMLGGSLLRHLRRHMSLSERRAASVRKMLHQWLGWATAILGFAQVPLGLALYGSPAVFYILYALLMFTYLVAHFVLSYRATRVRARKLNDAEYYIADGYSHSSRSSGHPPRPLPPVPPPAPPERGSRLGCGSGLLAIFAAYLGYKWLRRHRNKSKTESSDTSTSSPTSNTTTTTTTTTIDSSDVTPPPPRRSRSAGSRGPTSGRSESTRPYSRGPGNNTQYDPPRSCSRSRTRSPPHSRSRSPYRWPVTYHSRGDSTVSDSTGGKLESVGNVGKTAAGAAVGAGIMMGIRRLFGMRKKQQVLEKQPGNWLDSPARPALRPHHATTTDLRQIRDGGNRTHSTDFRRVEEGHFIPSRHRFNDSLSDFSSDYRDPASHGEQSRPVPSFNPNANVKGRILSDIMGMVGRHRLKRGHDLPHQQLQPYGQEMESSSGSSNPSPPSRGYPPPQPRPLARQELRSSRPTSLKLNPDSPSRAGADNRPSLEEDRQRPPRPISIPGPPPIPMPMPVPPLFDSDSENDSDRYGSTRSLARDKEPKASAQMDIRGDKGIPGSVPPARPGGRSPILPQNSNARSPERLIGDDSFVTNQPRRGDKTQPGYRRYEEVKKSGPSSPSSRPVSQSLGGDKTNPSARAHYRPVSGISELTPSGSSRSNPTLDSASDSSSHSSTTVSPRRPQDNQASIQTERPLPERPQSQSQSRPQSIHQVRVAAHETYPVVDSLTCQTDAGLETTRQPSARPGQPSHYHAAGASTTLRNPYSTPPRAHQSGQAVGPGTAADGRAYRFPPYPSTQPMTDSSGIFSPESSATLSGRERRRRQRRGLSYVPGSETAPASSARRLDSDVD